MVMSSILHPLVRIESSTGTLQSLHDRQHGFHPRCRTPPRRSKNSVGASPSFTLRISAPRASTLENAMAPEYWEVGASGRRYSRDFVLRSLEQSPPADSDMAGWQCSDYGLRRLGPDTYLFTYTLRQGERITRRATIWQSTATGWRILYHQGTIVLAEEEFVFRSLVGQEG